MSTPTWGARPVKPLAGRSGDVATRIAVAWCREHGHDPVMYRPEKLRETPAQRRARYEREKEEQG